MHLFVQEAAKRLVVDIRVDVYVEVGIAVESLDKPLQVARRNKPRLGRRA